MAGNCGVTIPATVAAFSCRKVLREGSTTVTETYFFQTFCFFQTDRLNRSDLVGSRLWLEDMLAVFELLMASVAVGEHFFVGSSRFRKIFLLRS